MPYEWRHGTGKGTDHRTQRCFSFERSVQAQVAGQRDYREQARQCINSDRQVDAACERWESPKQRAEKGSSLPAASGRLRVRRIRASYRRSTYWFSVPAPPATTSVPSSVLINSTNGKF